MCLSHVEHFDDPPAQLYRIVLRRQPVVACGGKIIVFVRIAEVNFQVYGVTIPGQFLLGHSIRKGVFRTLRAK